MAQPPSMNPSRPQPVIEGHPWIESDVTAKVKKMTAVVEKAS